jgi:hypothetical protein
MTFNKQPSHKKQQYSLPSNNNPAGYTLVFSPCTPFFIAFYLFLFNKKLKNSAFLDSYTVKFLIPSQFLNPKIEFLVAKTLLSSPKIA